LHTHDHGQVEGLEGETEPMGIGEAIESAEEVEHAHAGKSDEQWAREHDKRPGKEG
ncbi:MAG: hypothetical protein H6948_13010, partial [Zoogloeaceae bacterium]|nr:hypothetical protein [Zoogloeaceae bacterium]